MINKKSALAVSIAAVLACNTSFAQEQRDEAKFEEVIVLSQKTTYANSLVSDSMKDQQSTLTSVLAAIDNLPGVLINEGDVFGSDDWSTTVSIRGFQISLDEQQIGMTVDGVPNGNSNYGGGAKANRYVDTLNLETIVVSQGTADIASRSHEALGGTLDFRTQDPEDQERMRFNTSLGDFDARKFYVRYDTGLFWGNTKAYFSFSDSNVKSWIDQSGETNRTHAAVKLISEQSWATITSYLSYDDTEEDNYQRVTLADFRQNPEWDRLNGDWTGVPFLDQVYRPAWSTLRENLLAYVRFDFEFNDAFSAQLTPYYHDNEGRGDWVPPYVVDVTDDGDGSPHSELVSGNTVRGGAILGQIGYVTRDGRPLTPGTDCSSLTFPYGGTSSSNLHLDPACFPDDAIPVGSYRHTHYEKSRVGITGDGEWATEFADISNVLRVGFWYEDQTRYESRDWHKIIDSQSSFHFDNTPYWIQYDRSYPQETMMYYIEDAITLADVTLRLGGKQWFVDVEREDKFIGAAGSASVSSDSDFLVSTGALWQATDEIEVFAGYAENYAAIKDVVLEAANLSTNPQALDDIEPETAENLDLGVRYNGDRFSFTATLYQIDFENRITLFSPDSVTGIDFLEQQDGEYRNSGGIESEGLELSFTWDINDNFSLYASYTDNDSTYIGFDRNEFGDNVSDADFTRLEQAQGVFRDNTVFGSVEDLYVLSIDWSKDAYRAGFSTKHVGDRWLNPQNTDRAEAYDVADIYIAVTGDDLGDVFQGYEFRFTVNNVFDEDYIGGIAGGSGGWIGGPRTAALSIQFDI